MKLSLDWLSDFVTFTEKDARRIADRLTIGAAEVEDIEIQGELLQHCCVGKVLSVRKHPNADTLLLADVETDQGKKRVVCGGTNLREGMLVAFAHVGANVRWHGTEMMTLTKTRIRGEESEGMICAAEELDLGNRFPPKKEDGPRPILDLSELKAGIPLQEALGLSDTIFHIDNHAITHRPDLFSHIGFARECVALGLAEWKKKLPASRFPLPAFPKNPLPFSVACSDTSLVPRYVACSLHIEALGETPDWMRHRLEAVGIRSLTLPVDITNYIMMELGIPLHAFDLKSLRGAELEFRTSLAKETVTTLDGGTHVLPEGVIILADKGGPVDLCGIMGGKQSATTQSTVEIFLHVPVYDPVRIRRATISLGHRSDASTIYEKGVPHCSAKEGFLRAVGLFMTLCPGARPTSQVLEWGTDGKPKAVTLPLERITSVLGAEIPEKKIKDIFTDLGFEVKKGTPKNSLAVTPPSWRIRDITEERDLIEEIGRIAGYDRIEPCLPEAAIAPPARDHRLSTLRAALREAGYGEILPLSLIGPELMKRTNMNPEETVAIENPLSEDLSLLQGSNLPRLLQHAEEHLLLAEKMLSTFTVGTVFDKESEHPELGLLLVAKEATGVRNDVVLSMKHHLNAVLSDLNLSMHTEPATSAAAWAHPGRIAKLVVEKKEVGLLCEMHPAICARFGLPHRTACALVDLSALLSLPKKERFAEPLPMFPSVSYDITVTRNHTSSAEKLLTNIRSASTLLADVEVRDLFSGPPLKEGDYNLTIRCVYRAPDRTLTEEEAKKEHEKVMKLTTGK